MSKVAVVTGASRGIGAATAAVLASQGWDVAVGYRQDSAAASSVVDACIFAGRRAVALQVDMADAPTIVNFFTKVDEELGQLAALVNCAGVVDQKARVDEYPPGRVERMFAINVVGPFACAHQA